MSEGDKLKQIKINCKGKFTRFKTYVDKFNVDERQIDATELEELKIRVDMI